MIEVGQKVRFDPMYNAMGFLALEVKGAYVTGKVVMVNEDHKWFSVEYGNPRTRTSFKFWDIGKTVNIIG